MSGGVMKIPPVLTVAAVAVAIAAGGVSLYALNSASEWRTTAERLQQEADGQSAIVARNAMTFQRFNEIASSAGRYDIRIDAQAQEQEVIYREKIRDQDCAVISLPADVANGLYRTANALRVRALSASPGVTVSEAVVTPPAYAMTYGQAVRWIPGLLGTVDKLYSRLDDIAAAERARNTSREIDANENAQP